MVAAATAAIFSRRSAPTSLRTKRPFHSTSDSPGTTSATVGAPGAIGRRSPVTLARMVTLFMQGNNCWIVVVTPSTSPEAGVLQSSASSAASAPRSKPRRLARAKATCVGGISASKWPSTTSFALAWLASASSVWNGASRDVASTKG
jgi:hypothetical protein